MASKTSDTSSKNINFNSMRQKFNLDSLQLVSHNTNIIDQIPSYNSELTSNFINSLQSEYEEQKQINTILQDKVSDKNISEIKNFISTHNSEIDNQISELEDIIPKIKSLIEQNKALRQSQDNYNAVINSSESQMLANKMRRIKVLKKDISVFLEKNGF